MKNTMLSQAATLTRSLGIVIPFFLSVSAFAGTDQLSQSGARPESEDGESVVLFSSLDALSDAAGLTAAFNVGTRAASTYPPNLLYQILYTGSDPTATNNTGGTYTTFIVKPGTQLYVPVMYNDNSLPIIGDFPPAGNRRALLHYFHSQEEFGLVYARIVVDGRIATLGPHYVVEVSFPNPLPDGATLYQTIAAFLAPLRPGTHSVQITALATGEAFSIPPIDQYFPGGVFSFSTIYTVIVQ